MVTKCYRFHFGPSTCSYLYVVVPFRDVYDCTTFDLRSWIALSLSGLVALAQVRMRTALCAAAHDGAANVSAGQRRKPSGQAVAVAQVGRRGRQLPEREGAARDRAHRDGGVASVAVVVVVEADGAGGGRRADRRRQRAVGRRGVVGGRPALGRRRPAREPAGGGGAAVLPSTDFREYS
eukprot:SAG11_NODE_5095_length_1665_cov_21.558748_2_plen_179_part_00